jgi:hypothetical protein
MRYAVSLMLLVGIIGGIAWVAQYLPTWNVPKKDVPLPAPEKGGLAFARAIAQWYPPKAGEKKSGEDAPSAADQFPFKDFEQGTTGHYDFLFKNVSETDIDIVFYTSDCDCNSIEVATLPGSEADRLLKLHNENPGEPSPYTKEPEMKKLGREVLSETTIRIKAGDGGVVRINFNAKKSPGQELRVQPRIWYQPADVPAQRVGQGFVVPVMVRQPVSFNPQRVSVGVLVANGMAQGTLIAWSSTRKDLKLELGAKDDPFFHVDVRPLAKEEYSSLDEALKAEKNTPPCFRR